VTSESLVWQVGEISVHSFVEILDAGEVIQEVIPDATADNIKAIPWLQPDFADADGKLKAVVQSFGIKTPSVRIIVDTCVGDRRDRPDLPAWQNLQTDFLTKLEKSGFGREDVDVVLCTHLHFDHVGWNTMEVNGKFVPTFPRARYLFARQEFEYWKTRPSNEVESDHNGFVDSVMPVVDAGLVELVESDHCISEGVFLLPTPGHTPSHVSVWIESQGKRAVVTGDVMHHPCQIARPDWSTLADTSQEMARNTRREILERFADSEVLIIGSHFSSPTVGHIRRDGDSYMFKV